MSGSDKQLHWFCLSYRGESLAVRGEARCSSVCVGIPDRKLTVARMAEGRKGAGVAPGAALLAASYLGYMTDAEFGGEEGES